MDNTKEIRKQVKKAYGADHPLLDTFDRVSGMLLAGKDRVSTSMVGDAPSVLQHFLTLSGDSLHFLEMKFILPEKDGTETELPPSSVKRWYEDHSEAVLHPKSGEVVSNMDQVCIWFYPRGEG